jgi:Arylsulfotransferase (ASST)
MRALILGPALALGLALGPAAMAGAGRSAPACTPATLNNSALQAGSVTVSPLAGSRDASPRSQISFLGVPAGDLGAISVVGSRTGAHAGRLAAYSQGDGGSFLPARPFAEGERVTVRARLRNGRSSVSLLDRFVIARADPIDSTPEAVHPGRPTDVQSFVSRPDLHPPAVAVTAQSPAVAAGDEFLAPYSGPGQAGPMILDQTGRLVWFKALATHTSATNFRVQEYEGRPVLTWWQGDITRHGFGVGEDEIDDATYSTIARVNAGNGYRADLHEFQLTGQGTALLTAYNPILCNLSAAGGPAYGAVTDGVIQEIDVRTGLVMFEWTSLNHVALSESYERASGSTTASPFDFFHLNSINLDQDGSLLVSARNTWTVYDLDGRSGRVLWRLGGRLSSFRAGHGSRTAWQHDPRQLTDGSISIFDNGASPSIRSQSRGIVLRLDPQSRGATVTAQFTHTPPLLAESQGNMQALENGDWFFGWGQLPYFSEYGPDGKVLFDAHLPAHEQSYRSFRFPWTGTPAHRPTFALRATAGAHTVFASWNGATLVAYWRVLAGRDPASLQPVAEAPRGAFETAVPLPAGTTGPDVAVQALDATGQVLGTSATVAEPIDPFSRQP